MDIGHKARLVEAAFVVAIALFALAAQVVRKRAAASRLRRIDAGELCIACGATELKRTDDRVQCTICGKTVALGWLRSAKVADREIADMTERSDDP